MCQSRLKANSMVLYLDERLKEVLAMAVLTAIVSSGFVELQRETFLKCFPNRN